MSPDEGRAPYRTMAGVYDRWMEHDKAPYELWCSVIDRELRRHATDVADILEIGCGTGAMTARLRDLGYHVTGVDASPEMLEMARAKLGTSVALVQARMPAPQDIDLGTHDAAICCFDTANYLVEDGQLSEAFGQVAAALRPGGVFIVDTNTQFKLERVFGDHRLGDDLDEFAYVWRSRYDPATRTCVFLLSFFVAEGDLYRRTVERHVQRPFSPDEVRAALAANGFSVTGTLADYTDAPYSETTSVITWVARRG
jgi:SAM-dependent methyltransferase